jgi:DNA processing protein
MKSEKSALLALSLVHGIGNRTLKNLISYCGSATKVLQTSTAKLQRIPGIGPSTAANITSNQLIEQAEQELSRCEKASIQILSYTDKEYPFRLKQIPDAPPIIYKKGNIILDDKLTIAIVGTRNATNYGKQLTEKLVEDLSIVNPVIISGLAYGIDIHAHRAALKHDLSTIAVLGSGIDVIYPSAHKSTANEMLDKGALFSEQPLGAKPDAFNFPSRNRIIAGIADITIVVEAAIKGGALITAELANSYDREVAAFPGNVGATYSEGCNKLIKENKAHLIEHAQDVFRLMNWDDIAEGKPAKPSYQIENFEESEWQVIETLKQNDNVLAIDLLSIKSQITLNQLASILLQLEFKGVVKSLPGKKYQLL